MKTKIEYSVNLQDVPKNLRDKFKNISDEMEQISAYITAIAEDLEHENVTIVSGRIDRTRRRLFDIDSGLEDCDNAIKLYTETVRQLQQAQSQ